jgi:hypothetical protein
MTESRNIRTRRGLQLGTLRQWVRGRDRTGCWLWPFKKHKGYGQIHDPRTGRPTRVHRLAFEMATGAPAQRGALHACNTPACCNPDHVYDGDQRDNHRDAVLAGTARHPPRRAGERHPMAKLTPEQVAEIRASSESGAALGRRFNVTRTTVSYIRTGKNWRAA